jgi:hypothetical protein
LGVCPAAEAAALGDADKSWKVYIPLWAAIMRGTDLPAQDTFSVNEHLHLWTQPVYDTLLAATLDALRNLDLDYSHATESSSPVETEEVQVLATWPSIATWHGLLYTPACAAKN